MTPGALVMATVSLAPHGTGVRFFAGEGVGTVTRAGLQLAVGEPAISPAPRRMMEVAVAGSAKQARACSAWARPISPPSTVAAALFDMLWGLNGRTARPRRA